MLIAHWKTFTPNPNPVTPLVESVGVVTIPAPEIKLHNPVPMVGVFAAMVAVVAQTVWLFPAKDTVGFGSRIMATVEIDGGQTPLLMVHCNTFVPTDIAVMPVTFKVVVVIITKPEITVQLPVPTPGKFPFNVAVGEHTV